MSGRAARLTGIVTARRASAQGRLAACLARQRQLRARAAELAQTARTAPPGADAADMALTADWQAHLRDAARAALAEANGLEDEATCLRAGLALALGREHAVEALAAAEAAARRRQAERRAENAVPARGHGPVPPGGNTRPRPS